MKSVITAMARTPIGSFLGSLASFRASQLGSIVIKNIIDKTNLKNNLIDEVIMGNVLCSGVGQAPARQAALFGGLSNHTECTTINKVCGSGLKAVMLADQIIQCEDSKMIIAGGMESMSQTPHLSYLRKGLKLGQGKLIDSMIYDGLTDAYDNVHMGQYAEVLNRENKILREEQDDFAMQSYKRAQNAIKNNLFNDEIIPIEIKNKKGIVTFSHDEEPGKLNLDKVKTLKPVFDKSGSITAANASSLSDGAAAILVMSAAEAKKLGQEILVEIVAHSSYAHDPKYFTTAPIGAIKKVLNKASYDLEDIDLFEINEAFSCVTIATINELGIHPSKVNINGGAVALGHPIGASGARILVTLINALIKNDLKIGLAVLCIGGGEAAAMIIKRS